MPWLQPALTLRCTQVSIAAHTLIAQQHGDRAGPHLVCTRNITA
jgi:hypothetical protein